MRRYPFIPPQKRRRKTRKWKFLLLLLLVIGGMKFFTDYLDPPFTFGKADHSLISITNKEIQTETGNHTPTLEPQVIFEPIIIPEKPEPQNQPDPQLTVFLENTLNQINTDPSKIIEVRNELNEKLSTSTSKQQLVLIKQQLEILSEKWLFSENVFPDDTLCIRYNVKPGDQFGVISKVCNVPYEILMKINDIKNPRNLRAGQAIKIINGPFHCIIHSSDSTMDLYLQDVFVKSFEVALGKPGMETPTGNWIIRHGSKLISPTWTDPSTGKTYYAQDPDYPLGARWVGLKGIDGPAKDRTGFAIIGTGAKEQIKARQTQGAICMYNKDVKLIYDLLTPGLSKVIVSD